MERIYNALILNDYPEKHYATWVYEMKKTIETRMKAFKFRGEIVICCGNKSVTNNAGKALCIVELYNVRDMQDIDAKEACIQNGPGRKALLLRNWKFFSRKFTFTKQYVEGSYQSIFKISIPEDVKITEAFKPCPSLDHFIPEINK